MVVRTDLEGAIPDEIVLPPYEGVARKTCCQVKGLNNWFAKKRMRG
jgi:hypothetical protein